MNDYIRAYQNRQFQSYLQQQGLKKYTPSLSSPPLTHLHFHLPPQLNLINLPQEQQKIQRKKQKKSNPIDQVEMPHSPPQNHLSKISLPLALYRSINPRPPFACSKSHSHFTYNTNPQKNTIIKHIPILTYTRITTLTHSKTQQTLELQLQVFSEKNHNRKINKNILKSLNTPSNTHSHQDNLSKDHSLLSRAIFDAKLDQTIQQNHTYQKNMRENIVKISQEEELMRVLIELQSEPLNPKNLDLIFVIQENLRLRLKFRTAQTQFEEAKASLSRLKKQWKPYEKRIRRRNRKVLQLKRRVYQKLQALTIKPQQKPEQASNSSHEQKSYGNQKNLNQQRKK